MATPNRPPFPEWYQADRKVSPHVGPTQREMLARRIKSLRKVLVGVSFVGVAAFAGLASQHTATTTAATASNGSTTTALVQQNTSTTSANTSSSSSNSATLSSVTASQPNTSSTSSGFHTRTRSS